MLDSTIYADHLTQSFSAEQPEGAYAGLLPFLPMLYVGWSDAVLTPSQVEVIRGIFEQQEWLKPAEKAQLRQWMDPAHPPSVADLKRWLAIIQDTAADIPGASRHTLAELGLQIARIGSPDERSRCATPAACQALQEVEAALGVVGHEAVQTLVHDGPTPPAPAAADDTSLHAASFERAAMTALLDGEYAELRHRVRRLLTDPVFAYESIPDRERYRERVLSWSKLLAQQGLGSLAYPPAYGGQADRAQFIVVMETLSHHDLSLVIKFGVQFGLFGGSIHQLGTEYHHRTYLPDIGLLALPGAFAMTELGHGSNVRDIETIARYDRETEEFIIHTPCETARKEYIGNAACHGRLATVFAQLEIDGENHGVNAFLTPLRDGDGHLMPGVCIEDNGEKMGLNGVDNGRIWFDQVRIPRTAMLDRFAQVTPEGHYRSSIANESRRFFTMLSTLVTGRIGIAFSALSAAKSALTIATRYAAQRRQFGPPGQSETLLLDYQTHQRRLMPLLANAYALDFALKFLLRRFKERTDEDLREIETLAAGLKAYSTWNTTDTVQESREACGAQGYMAVNRLAALKADTDIFTTFEGDNTVLMQLVAKACLSEFKQQFHDMKLLGLVRHIAAQATQAVAQQNPVITRTTDEDHLRSSDFQSSALAYREQTLLVKAAKRLQKAIEAGEESYTAFLRNQNLMVDLAHAHIERVILNAFVDGIAQVDDPALVEILEKLRALFALSHIDQRKGWYLEHSYLEPTKSKAIARQVEQLSYEVSREAVALVDAFAIPDQCLAAPIAL